MFFNFEVEVLDPRIAVEVLDPKILLGEGSGTFRDCGVY